MSESGGEKTEKATPQKLKEAKKRGQVAQSRDFVSSVTFGLGLLALWLSLSTLTQASIQLTNSLWSADLLSVSPKSALARAQWILLLTLPMGMIVIIASYAASYIQTGFIWAPDIIKPQFNRINPSTKLKSLFKTKQLVELLKTILKMCLVFYISYRIADLSIRDFLLLSHKNLDLSLQYTFNFLFRFLATITILYIILGVLDLLASRYFFSSQMKMSKAEVKQEYKKMEGDPQIKGKRRQIALELSFEQIAPAVEEANVVIVNPVHIAVALAYDANTNTAPIVRAKGLNRLAVRLKRAAEKRGVTIIQDINLARELHKIELGCEIPESLYEPVAEILRQIYQIEKTVSKN